MPLYEYNCETCSYTFDKMVMRVDSQVNCPICKEDEKKTMSTFSVGHSHNGPANVPHDMQPKMCANC